MNFKYSIEDRRFISILVLVHAVFFLLALHYARIYMGDSFEYIYEAINIKSHLFFYSGNPVLPIEPEYMTQRQPAYPLFLLGVYCFSINNWIVLLLQNCLSIVNICYCRKVFQEVGLSKKADWLLLLLVISYPSQFINVNTIAPDILLQTCTVFYFGSLLQFMRTRELPLAFKASLWLVAGLMVKPVLYPFVVVHFVWLVVFGTLSKVKLQRLVLVALVPLFVVLIYNYTNYTRTGKFHFSSNQAFNAVYYFYPYFSYTQGADSANKFLANERASIKSIPEYCERYDRANAVGISLLKENFASYMLFHIMHSLGIFFEPGKAEMDLFTGKLTYGKLYSKEQAGFRVTWKNEGWGGVGHYIGNNPSMIWAILVLLFNCVRIVGFIVFLCQRNIPISIRLFSFLLVGYFAFAAGPIANTRYFLPVVLVVTCCACIGINNALKREVARFA